MTISWLPTNIAENSIKSFNFDVTEINTGISSKPVKETDKGTNKFQISGIQPATEYRIKVEVELINGLKSDWSANFIVKTLPEKIVCKSMTMGTFASRLKLGYDFV